MAIVSAPDSDVHTGAKGQKVGAYTLLELIGGGGMGEVWRARHDLLDRLAAVKLIRPEKAFAGADETRKRFEREARATSALKSPHTIAIYDFGVTPQRIFYYAMELLEGFSLDVLVERFGEVPPARAVHLLRGACESLSEAHQRGLIHRDIKPANLFTSATGMNRDFVKVLDFGLVKQIVSDGLTALTAENAVPGSPAFLAPEAASGNLTPKADVYALGCVAYWLLTANYVFGGATALEVMLGHMQSQPAPPSERARQTVPRALETLVMDCLRKKPGERPDMKELGERLAAIAVNCIWSPADAEAWWNAHGESTPADIDMGRTRGWSDTERSRRVAEGVDRLQRHFDESHLDVADLDRRIALVKMATDEVTLATAFSNLPVLAASQPPQALVRRPSEALAIVERSVVCVMNSFVHRYDLTPGTLIKAVTVMGASVLDFRGGIGGPGVVEARCVAVMGAIEIIVPPGIHVEIETAGFWGSMEQIGNVAPPAPDRPTLRVTGVVVMASIEVKVQA